MSSEIKRSPWTPFLHRLEQLAHDEGDSSDLAIQKTLVLTFALIMSIAGILWGAIYLIWDEPIASFWPFAYSFFSLVNIILLRYHKHFAWFRDFQQFLTLMIPFTLMLYLGGYANSGAVVAWSFIAPLSIGVVTDLTGSQQLGIAPLLVLFLIGLVLLVWVKADGERQV